MIWNNKEMNQKNGNIHYINTFAILARFTNIS